MSYYNYTILFTGMDVYWNKNVLLYLTYDQRYFSTDLIMSLHYSSTIPNSGFFLIRSNDKTIILLRLWYEKLIKLFVETDDQLILSSYVGAASYNGIYPIGKSLKLTWYLVSNLTVVLWEPWMLTDGLYNLNNTYNHSNNVLSAIHFTNLPTLLHKQQCLNESYRGLFLNITYLASRNITSNISCVVYNAIIKSIRNPPKPKSLLKQKYNNTRRHKYGNKYNKLAAHMKRTKRK